VPGLWALSAGRIPPNPAELLGSRRFKDFLASLSEHFDCVVIDSPPVLAVTDVLLVAHATSGAARAPCRLTISDPTTKRTPSLQ
jgi:Mrp family chromosome partitioning ATPase